LTGDGRRAVSVLQSIDTRLELMVDALLPFELVRSRWCGAIVDVATLCLGAAGEDALGFVVLGARRHGA